MLAHEFVCTEPIVQKGDQSPFYYNNNHPYRFLFNDLFESMSFNLYC